MNNIPANKYFRIAIFVCSLLVPGSGFVLLGKPVRGLMYVVWIFFFGYLTYKFTSPNISMIGRYSGGLAVWMLSVVEVCRMLNIRSNKR